MLPAIEKLMQNSNLPGPRSNLALLYAFSKTADEAEILACLTYCHTGLSNCPEEFVVCCGIVGYCVYNRTNISETLDYIRPFASHQSWRIREAVAMGIQEMTEHDSAAAVKILTCLGSWVKDGNAYEKRAVVAALCDPKPLRFPQVRTHVPALLNHISLSEFENVNGKLSDPHDTLRKALGYGWSVAIVAAPEEGKPLFEALSKQKSKHLQWIIRENLKKHRLSVMDSQWVEQMKSI